MPLLVAQLGVAAVIGLAQGPGLDLLGASLLVVVSVLPAFATRYPLPALLGTAIATGTYLGLDQPGGPVVLGLVVCVVIASARRGSRAAVWAVLYAGVAVSLVVFRAVGSDWPPWGHVAALMIGAAGLGLLGELVRERTARFAEMRSRAAERSRRQASDERLRLAQELHDVLAHDVSLVNVQASTALHLFDTDPGRAREALAAIKEVSHETLQELRATVTALRANDDSAPLRPGAGLADLDALAERSTAAGLTVTIHRTGDVRQLPPRIELAGFRVAQEALTNARRHSGATQASIDIDYGADALGLVVTDRGRGRSTTTPDGHGIVGMRERATALGGGLETGVPDGGGFEVRAWFPLSSASGS